MKNFLKDWKYPLLLLSGVGIANLGAWIYLIALNVLVYNMGGSALAVCFICNKTISHFIYKRLVWEYD